jgi:branched-chain amino acid transport system ATP-binding protein
MLLDEPSLGLAPLIVEDIFRIIDRIRVDQKMAILLVEQNARAALGIADEGYVMENGRIVMGGSADKLRDNEDVREFYLGLSAVGSRKSYRDVKHYRRKKRWQKEIRVRSNKLKVIQRSCSDSSLVSEADSSPAKRKD